MISWSGKAVVSVQGLHKIKGRMGILLERMCEWHSGRLKLSNWVRSLQDIEKPN